MNDQSNRRIGPRDLMIRLWLTTEVGSDIFRRLVLFRCEAK